MYEGMRVKYLFINLKYPAYVKLQSICVLALLIGAVLCYLFTRDSQFWLLRNGWWIGIVGALAEIVESLVAINAAKYIYRRQADDSDVSGNPGQGDT